MGSPAFSTSSEPRLGLRYSARQWEEWRSAIERLYIKENRRAKDIVNIFKETGFFITEKQLKDKLKQWDARKNVSKGDMLNIARERAIRKKLENKPSPFIDMNGKSVQEAKIDRFLKRKNISESSLLSMTSPVVAPAPAFAMLTPPSPSFEGLEETMSLPQASDTSFSLPPTPDVSNAPPYPATSSLAYYEKEENWNSKTWRELRIDPYNPPPPPDTSWIQNVPAPPVGWDLGVRKDGGGHAQVPAEKNLLPQRTLSLQAEEDSCRKKLARAELEHGAEHEGTLNALRNLAFVLYKRCRYEPAELLLRRAVEAGREAFGDDHLAILETRLNLTMVIQEQGRYSEAEHLQRELLDALEKTAGTERKHTLQTKLSLAVSLTRQRRFDEAAHLQSQILKVCVVKFGSSDAFTHLVQGDLALSLVRQGTRSQTVESCRLEVDVRERELGEHHPHTIRSKLLLASALSEVGNHNARGMVAAAIWRFLKGTLGDEHPETVKVEGHLAFCLSQRKLHREAEKIYRKVWTTMKAVLGEEHPDTLQSLLDIASHLERQSKHKEAEVLFNQIFETRLQMLEKGNHQQALHDLARVAASKMLQEQYHEAERLFRRVLTARKDLLRDDHPDIFIGEMNVGLAMANQGRCREAEDMLQDTMTMCRKAWKDEHLATMQIVSATANILKRQGRYKDALPLLRELLETRKRVLGGNHLVTHQTAADLKSCIDQN